MENDKQFESNQQAETESKTNLSPVNKGEKLPPVIDDLERAISLWWKNLKNFLLIYWQGLKPALIPLFILLVLYILKQYAAPSSFFFSWSYIALTTIVYLFALYFFLRAQITTFLFIKSDYQGEIKKLYKDSKSLLWPYLGLSLLTAVLVLLWSLLLIIPGIIFSVFYTFAIYVFFCEGKRGMDALRRSRSLVSGYFWPVFGRILFLLLVTLIFAFVITLPSSVVPKESLAFEAWSAVMQILNIIVAPVYLIFFFKIYNDLVKIKK